MKIKNSSTRKDKIEERENFYPWDRKIKGLENESSKIFFKRTKKKKIKKENSINKVGLKKKKTFRGLFSCFNLRHKIKLARFGTNTITEPNLDVR